jgi:hypothetical protein
MGRIGAGRGFQRLALFFELIDLLAHTPEKKILASPTMRRPSTGRPCVSCMTSSRMSSTISRGRSECRRRRRSPG